MENGDRKIKVSDLTQYGICPRLVYFHAREHSEPGSGNERSMVERILLKELAFNLYMIYGSEAGYEGTEQKEVVERIINDIADDVKHVYKRELSTLAADVFDAVKLDLASNILKDSEWLNKIRAENELLVLQKVHGYDREHTMVSEKLSLSGSVDKLIVTDDEVIPCMIKTGKCPEYSVWRSDRMQLAAYSMLIEAEFETTVRRGFVEYIRTAEFRACPIRRKDRAFALQTLKHVKRIKRGAFPDKGANAPCDNCIFLDQCETRKTLLSMLFRK